AQDLVIDLPGISYGRHFTIGYLGIGNYSDLNHAITVPDQDAPGFLIRSHCESDFFRCFLFQHLLQQSFGSIFGLLFVNYTRCFIEKAHGFDEQLLPWHVDSKIAFRRTGECHEGSAMGRQHPEESFLARKIACLCMTNLSALDVNCSRKCLGANLNNAVDAVQADQLNEVGQTDVIYGTPKAARGALSCGASLFSAHFFPWKVNRLDEQIFP